MSENSSKEIYRVVIILAIISLVFFYYANSRFKIPSQSDNYVHQVFSPKLDIEREHRPDPYTRLNINVSGLENSTIEIKVIPTLVSLDIKDGDLFINEDSLLCLELIRVYVSGGRPEEITELEISSLGVDQDVYCAAGINKGFNDLIHFSFYLPESDLQKEIGWYDSFYYPFMNVNSDIEIEYSFAIKNDNKIDYRFSQISYSYEIALQDSSLWKANIKFPKNNISSEFLELDGYSSLIIKSTPYYRFLFVIIFGGLFLLSTLLFFVKETPSFIEATGALFLGIFSVDQVIVPNHITPNENNLTNFSIILMYLYLSIIILDHAFLKLLKILKSQNETNEQEITTTQVESVSHQNDNYLDVKDLVKITGLHPDTIRKRARENKIPAVKIDNKWRFPIEDLKDNE